MWETRTEWLLSWKRPVWEICTCAKDWLRKVRMSIWRIQMACQHWIILFCMEIRLSRIWFWRHCKMNKKGWECQLILMLSSERNLKQPDRWNCRIFNQIQTISKEWGSTSGSTHSASQKCCNTKLAFIIEALSSLELHDIPSFPQFTMPTLW